MLTFFYQEKKRGRKMLAIILFLVAFFASSIGAVVGAGGGVIIKPVVDMLGLLPVATVSFCSGCTVLGMSCFSLIRNRNNGIKLQLRSSTLLAAGAVAGGLIGQALFEFVRNGFQNEEVLGGIQAVCLTCITFFVFLYVCKKESIPSKHVTNAAAILAIGASLGLMSSFLGIGGGPANVAVLFFFFSMDAKEAAKNSLYIIVFSQVSSLISALATHSVPEFQWTQLIAMICGGIGGAMVGAVMSKRMNNQGVELMFKILLLGITGVGVYNILKYTVL